METRCGDAAAATRTFRGGTGARYRYKFPTTSQALAARLSDEGRVKDTVPVKISSLVVLCVLAGVALGSALTLLAKESKAKEPTEQEPLLAKA